MRELGRGSNWDSGNYVDRSSGPRSGSSMFGFSGYPEGGRSGVSKSLGDKSAEKEGAEAGSGVDFVGSEAQVLKIDSSRSSKIGVPTQIQVDIALYSVVTRSVTAREERLVLRRTVSAAGDDNSWGQVEELWVSDTHRSVQSALYGLRELDGVFEHLMLGKVVDEVPGMSSPDAEVLKDLQRMRAGNGSSVRGAERLFDYSGAVKEVDNQLVLVDADVRNAPGSIAAREAWSLVTEAIDRQRLQMTESRSAGDAGQSLGGRSAGIARSFDGDIAHARLRLEQEERWRRIGNTRLEPQPGHYLDGLKTPDHSPAVWSYWERQPTEIATDIDDLKERGIDEEHDSVVITLIGVDGAQVGEKNEQFNLFRYRLDPQIDLHVVLRQPEVQTAFAEYTIAPDDEQKRQAAIRSLVSAHTRQQTDWQLDEQKDPIQHSESGSASWLLGTVVFSDSRGVQVGNNLMQRNTFTYTLAPSVNTNDLLCTYPELVESIVDYSCGLGGLTADSIQHGMADAVSGMAETVLMRAPGAGLRPMVSATYRNEVGLSVGDHNSQLDTIDVTSTVSKALRRVLDEEKLKHERERKRQEALEARRRQGPEHRQRPEQRWEPEPRRRPEPRRGPGENWIKHHHQIPSGPSI